jgi:hypothetical protein
MSRIALASLELALECCLDLAKLASSQFVDYLHCFYSFDDCVIGLVLHTAELLGANRMGDDKNAPPADVQAGRWRLSLPLWPGGLRLT